MRQVFLAVLLVATSPAGFAAWTLDSEASSVYYVTSKAAAVSELNSFSALSGQISDSGAATLDIGLASVDTAIDIRNERMRDILFQVASFPMAEISLQVDAGQLSAMATGQTSSDTYDATINLHGLSQTVSAELQVSKLAGGDILVSLSRPLIINAASFGLAEGVEELRNIAGLPSINNNVVVDFTLRYNAD